MGCLLGVASRGPSRGPQAAPAADWSHRCTERPRIHENARLHPFMPDTTRSGSPPAYALRVPPLYVSMLKWTKGPAAARDWPRRVDAQGKLIESRGGLLKHSYVTLGRFDVVLVFEAPSDEVAMGIILAIAE